LNIGAPALIKVEIDIENANIALTSKIQRLCNHKLSVIMYLHVVFEHWCTSPDVDDVVYNEFTVTS